MRTDGSLAPFWVREAGAGSGRGAGVGDRAGGPHTSGWVPHTCPAPRLAGMAERCPGQNQVPQNLADDAPPLRGSWLGVCLRLFHFPVNVGFSTQWAPLFFERAKETFRWDTAPCGGPTADAAPAGVPVSTPKGALPSEQLQSGYA